MKDKFYQKAHIIFASGGFCVALIFFIIHQMVSSSMIKNLIDIVIVMLLIVYGYIVGNQMKKLYAHAHSDYLTGLVNRKYFYSQLSHEISPAWRDKSELSMLMIDIDKFKRINDQHGHQAGDLALRSVASILREGVREYDTVARIGGEEFTVILPNTSKEQAAVIANRLKERVAGDAVSFMGHQLTISIGVASMQCNYTQEELFNLADTALYEAKKQRNTVMVAQDEATCSTVMEVLGNESKTAAQAGFY